MGKHCWHKGVIPNLYTGTCLLCKQTENERCRVAFGFEVCVMHGLAFFRQNHNPALGYKNLYPSFSILTHNPLAEKKPPIPTHQQRLSLK